MNDELPKIERIDSESTGACPCGCGEAAYPYTAEGREGYFDAAPSCAKSIAIDFVLGLDEEITDDQRRLVADFCAPSPVNGPLVREALAIVREQS